MLDTTPHTHAAGFPSDSTSPLACPVFHRVAEVPALFRVRVSPSVPQELSTILCGVPHPGASGASQVLVRLSSCMPRPEDSGGPAPPRLHGGARVAFGCVKTLGVRNKRLAKRYQHCRVRGHPCGLQDALSTLRPSCSPCLHGSALDARRDTGGWLPLARQGLSPCKRRQALLGAITLRVRRGGKRERGTSERCKPSPARDS